MSSNIQVQRICQYCGIEFTAKTTVTKFCSHGCGSKANKAQRRAKKILEASAGIQTSTSPKPTQSIDELKAREFLTVSNVSILLGCSRQNVYKLINSGKLKATNILEKKTIVRRCDLDELFEKSKQEPTNRIEENQFDISESYTIGEILDKYNISETALNNLIKREGIPKTKRGWYTYVPKSIIDTILT